MNVKGHSTCITGMAKGGIPKTLLESKICETPPRKF